jgi:hypothetical protein
MTIREQAVEGAPAMKRSETCFVCVDCREIIISKYPSPYPELQYMTIDVEDEGEPTLNVCEVCENEYHDVLYKATKTTYIFI